MAPHTSSRERGQGGREEEREREGEREREEDDKLTVHAPVHTFIPQMT